MGFKLGRVYVLEFEGTDMEGAIVKVRSPTIATLDDLLLRERGEEQWQIMLDHLVEWNLETEDGEPVPATVEGMKAHMEPGVPMIITREWYRAARGITAPLDRRSGDGQPSPEEENTEPSMPMETL